MVLFHISLDIILLIFIWLVTFSFIFLCFQKFNIYWQLSEIYIAYSFIDWKNDLVLYFAELVFLYVKANQNKSLPHFYIINLKTLLIFLGVKQHRIFFCMLKVEYYRYVLFSFSKYKVEKPVWRKYSLFIQNITHGCMALRPWMNRNKSGHS